MALMVKISQRAVVFVMTPVINHFKLAFYLDPMSARTVRRCGLQLRQLCFWHNGTTFARAEKQSLLYDGSADQGVVNLKLQAISIGLLPDAVGVIGLSPPPKRRKPESEEETAKLLLKLDKPKNLSFGLGIMFSGSGMDGAEAIKYQFAEHRKVLNMTGDVQSVEKCMLMFFSKWHKGKSPLVFFLRSGSDLFLLCVLARVVCVFVIVFHFVALLVAECFIFFRV